MYPAVQRLAITTVYVKQKFVVEVGRSARQWTLVKFRPTKRVRVRDDETSYSAKKETLGLGR